MALQTGATPPPYPIDDRIRERIHKLLDDELDHYEWDRGAITNALVWYTSASSGRVRIFLEPEYE